MRKGSRIFIRLHHPTTLLLLLLSSEVSSFVLPSPSFRSSINPISKKTTKTNSPDFRWSVPIISLASTSDSSKGTETPTSSTTSKIEVGSHDELMYALGVNLARQLGDVRPLVESSEELTLVARGLLDAVIGRLEDNDQRTLIGRRGDDLNVLVTDRANKIRVRIEESGREMLKQMSETEGAQVLPSGVVVHRLEPGPDNSGASGARPSSASSVKVHYHGTLPDGTIFDSTLGADPATFALNQVISGWKEALLTMHEGETAMVGIPPEAGYGPEGTPDGRIPGGASIFFKIQLIEVLTAGLGGSPTLLGADGKKLTKESSSDRGSGLLGADGKPM